VHAGQAGSAEDRRQLAADMMAYSAHELRSPLLAATREVMTRVRPRALTCALTCLRVRVR
jgi:hypothetical protein